MENKKCGCEDTTEAKTNEEKLKDNVGCGCEEETHQEDSECNCEEETHQDDGGCGCGTESDDSDVGCCGAVDLPDLSRVERPSKPKFIADESFIKEFEDYAHSLGISSIGYTLLNSDLLLKDKFVQYPFTIVLTMEMDNAIIKTAPGEDAKDLNDTAYVKASILTTKLSDFLRKEGYDTEIAQPMGGVVNFSLLGQSAGLGHIGDSGLLITPELGPRLKVSAIFVSIANLPVKEENEHDWIPEYCEMCNKCVKACPEKALIEKESCCGNEIELIQKKCVGCSLGCTYCIEACPFEEKGYSHVKAKFDKINAKLREKQAKNFDMGLWDKWLNKNTSLFTDLDDGFTMAIAMTDNENMIILNMADNELNVNLKSINELENSNADLLFVMDEKYMDELLKDPTTTKFAELLSSKKIDVYGLSDPMKLGKGYVAFLNKLGLSIGGECCG